MLNLIKKMKLKRRAIARLAALHFYGNPSAKLKVVGVTGTNGKTTVATLLYKVATALGYKAGLIGTVEYILAGEKRKATHTTPGPIPLNRLLKDMVNKGCEYVFMEVSSHAMDQKRVAGIDFAGGIFTNLTQDHLDYHKSMENYFLAKKKFFKTLPARAFALANIDDAHGAIMLEGIKAKKYFYGFEKACDFKGEIKRLDFEGQDLEINNFHIKSKLLGKFNSYNLLTVYSVCNLLNFDKNEVKKILLNIDPPKGRFDHFISSNGIIGVVDFAHSPDSLEKIIFALREVKSTDSRIITIFGCGGDRDPLKRRIMGKIGVKLSDFAILTSDNPRSEDPEKILAEMKTDLTMADLQKTKTIPDRREAIKKATEIAKSGDIILCAGKGHEKYQEIRGTKYPFNDMEELRKYLTS
jgi:UDP-N-acetylmuramoyl-L-alanyl-D-glutamate--2,6-diaminopimelate ligase